jgi:Zn-dependent membrane protease YugP
LYTSPNAVLLDWKVAYPFLIAYGASGAATVLLCVAVLFAIPDAAISASPLALTLSQRIVLFASYVPFTLIPLCIAVDLSMRTVKLIRAGLAAQDKRKVK